MKRLEKMKARELREQGKSIKSISKELSVSSGTVSRWVKDITLTDQQIKALNTGPLISAINNANNARELRKNFQKEGAERAKKGDPLFISGCMLYWGEGTKKKNTIGFTNSDPSMMIFFKKFLDKEFGFPNNNYTIHLNFFTDIRTAEEVEKYWTDLLNLPKTCLRKSTINYHSKYSKRRKHKLEYGTCCLRVNNTKCIQIIFGAIQELSGFKNDDWLDQT